MKYTYRLPIFEAPGDAFAKMSDDQFADYQKKNPGTAERAKQVRKQAQARAAKAGAKPSSSTGTSSAKPSGKKGLGTSAIVRNDRVVKSDSQGNKSNKVGGSGGSKRVSSAGGKAVDMGVKKVKVRDVTPGQKKLPGSASGSTSSSGSGSGGQKKISGGSGAGGNNRPPSGAGQKEMTRAKGGALAKREGPPGTPKKKGGMGLRAKGHVAAKALGWAAKVAKDTIGGATAAFGKSSWKEGITFRQYLETAVPIVESNLQEKPGDGYLGPTVNIGGKPYGVPNPIRIAQDAADTSNVINQKKVDAVKAHGGRASMPSYKLYNKQNSIATQVLFPGLKRESAWQRKEGKSKTGGLNEKGRKSYERENPGSDLKAPQPEGGPRKRSFCARMSGVKGPMKDEKGRPTRKALALRKWKC
jgi:hypothetical protein|tara:strand:- start:237 stop:1478 length:1242 start_codon:yes stop_codon:yes gene_type:complete